MGGTKPTGTLNVWYQNRIGEATTHDEIRGYWLFVGGVIAGLLGVVIFLVSDPRTMVRGIGYAVAALAPVLIMLGAVIRFPLRRAATLLAGAGAVVSLLALAWFVAVFPGGWPRSGGHMGVITTYALGLLAIGVAGAFIPLITDPIREQYEALQVEAAETKGAIEAHETEASELEAALASSQARIDELESAVEAGDAELASLYASQARFEVYEDAGGEWRWRLRHRNGNVIADGGEGYASLQKCEQGIGSVRRNALGAGLLRAEPAAETDEPADADEPVVAIPTVADEAAPSQGTFEVYEDEAGEWRWRLVHDNGNVIADSGQGYQSRSNVRRALDRVREHVATAAYLEIDPVAYEVYRDRGGQHRWRLLHENGRILADSGEGYVRHSSARDGLESVRRSIADASVEVVER